MAQVQCGLRVFAQARRREKSEAHGNGVASVLGVGSQRLV